MGTKPSNSPGHDGRRPGRDDDHRVRQVLAKALRNNQKRTTNDAANIKAAVEILAVDEAFAITSPFFDRPPTQSLGSPTTVKLTDRRARGRLAPVSEPNTT
ncbi:hypothetical protein KRM28CT15_03960 [Krasilnikovia sp. M28-CT-15]